jgi:hypothetical protein
VYQIPQLFEMEMEQLREEIGTEPDPEMWRWSPLDIYEFDRMLNVAWHIAIDHNIRLRRAGGGLRKISFVEAGCGIGTKLYIAKTKYGMEELGYEINEKYIQKSAELDLDVQIEARDLRAEPAPPWAMFDIVYTARPFKDDAEETAWERAVQDAMRPGAVLISAFTAIKPRTWECYYRFPFHGVWKKQAPGNYQDLIQRHTTGPDPLVPQPGPL